MLIRRKPELLEKARRRGLEVVAWPRETPIYPIDDYDRLQAYGYERGACPVAESVAARLIGLPTHTRITAAHRSQLVDLLKGHAA